MASEPWNRLHIPRPAIQSLVTVPASAETEEYIKAVVEKCLSVKQSLMSKVLETEKSALYSILYVYHHQLGYHKPYLALKQVEQCLKRLAAMGLEVTIQEMLDLCPRYFGKNVLTAEKHCCLPSQPIIEVVSIKILGACKLFLRLMDCCEKAFHLCLQHIYLEEFIVANVVLLGLLSRLWVLHRGILKKLISLYGAQYLLQKEVSDFQNMPYIKNFTFPTKIEDFLGPVYASINKRKLPHISFKKGALQILHTVFSSHDLDDNEEERHKSAFEELTDTVETVVDIGLPVQAKRSYRDNCGTFDVKTLCQKQQSSFNHPCNVKKKSMASKNKRIIQCYRKSNSECAGHLVPKLQETETFRELAEKLQYALKWCKRRKLLPEVLFFRKKCLRANRLKHVELLGYSLQKKLRCFKKSVCQSLCQGNLRRNHHMPSLRIPRLKWTVKHKVTCRRKRKRLNALNHPIIYSESGVERTHHKNASICLDLNLGAQEVSTATTDVLLASGHITANDKSESLSVPLCLETKIITDDIDDIFSSIGV
ncbi:hypothetical protein XENTR_v10006410 [Xenopus tropicalis]|uniref:Nucleolus and neural progenitor protein n=1 Tax=Xenopus tropicalis TaxID=8364 RepID=F6RUJ5_XENTR|nr:nucleolus and neural progenitor protein [Xenopus tropicalis]KAE8625835.1 hypothetical protein XENTR_v10006410 [Xenopus tropicalis]|eukprot:XP_002933056.1 PREDICTED: protein nepro homolog isoform X1 [Xenopus tropicalis]